MFKVTALTEKCLLRRGDSFYLPFQRFASRPRKTMWNLESTFRGNRKLETRTAESLSKLNLNFRGNIYIWWHGRFQHSWCIVSERLNMKSTSDLTLGIQYKPERGFPFFSWTMAWKKPSWQDFGQRLSRAAHTEVFWMVLVYKVQMFGILNNVEVVLKRHQRILKIVALSVAGNCKIKHWTNTLHVQCQKKLREWTYISAGMFYITQRSAPHS